MNSVLGHIIKLRPATLSDKGQMYEWAAKSDITSSMMGPPIFNDNPIPTWEEFIKDYDVHFFNDENPDNGRSYSGKWIVSGEDFYDATPLLSVGFPHSKVL